MSVPDNHLKTAGEHLEFQNRLEVTNKFSSECFERFQEIKIRRKHRYVVYKLGPEEMEVETIGARGATYEELKRLLPFSECRFVVFDHEFKSPDGRPVSKLWFISWFPNSSSTHWKMAYASAKGKFRDNIDGVFDMQVGSIEELGVNLGMEAEEDDDGEDFDF